MNAIIRNNVLVAGLAVCLLMLCGCAGLSKKAVEKHHYYLEVQRGEAEEVTRPDAVVLVRRMQVSPLYDGRELVYRMDGGRMESDFYNLFFVPPADMVSQNLRQWIGSAGLAGEVVADASLVQSDYILEGVVNALYADFSGDRDQAVAEMQFFLLDANSDDTVLFSKRYEERVPLGSKSPDAIVEGQRKAVQAVFERLESDLRDRLANP